MDSNLRNTQLWLAFKSGDSEALGQLASEHYRVLYNYATKFTKDRELIKDCIQDLFLYLWDQRENLHSSPFVTIYLLKSLKHNLFKKLNQEKMKKELVEAGEKIVILEEMLDNVKKEFEQVGIYDLDYFENLMTKLVAIRKTINQF